VQKDAKLFPFKCTHLTLSIDNGVPDILYWIELVWYSCFAKICLWTTVRHSAGDKPVVEVQVGSEQKRFTSEEISAAVSE
jgi:hypothetical protein